MSSADGKDAIFTVPKSLDVSLYKTPKQTLLVVVKAGIAKGLLLWWQIIMLGWNAGIFIGFGAGLTLVINGNLTSMSISGSADGGDVSLSVGIPSGILKLIAGAIFPIGLVMVVLSGAELFTGNVMYLAAARMANKTTWKNLSINWVLCYFGNLAGSLAVAYFLFHKSEIFQSDDVFPTPAQEYIFKVAHAKTSLEMWWPYFLRGIGCNFLVCMALWCVCACEDTISKIVALWWPIMGFVAMGYEHSVANMFFVPIAIMEGYDLSVNSFIRRNLIPVTLGNIVGGLVFIAVQYLIYHPYIEGDVKKMKLRQGWRKNVPHTSTEETEEESDDHHEVPGEGDTIFRDIKEKVTSSLGCRLCRDEKQASSYGQTPSGFTSAEKTDGSDSL